jgi:large subunit ribosomal protein L27
MGEPSTSYAGAAANPSAFACALGRRWATKKQAGSTKNRGGSLPKYLGLKLSDGQLAFPGQIIARQRGLRFHPGLGVGVGRDQTLFATTVGVVRFREARLTRHNKVEVRKRVDVEPVGGDYSEGYAEKADQMVLLRRIAKAALLAPH